MTTPDKPASTTPVTTTPATTTPEIVPPGLDYVASIESTDPVDIDPSYDLWIGGQPSTEPAANRYFPSVNPATEEHPEPGCGSGSRGCGPGGGRGEEGLRPGVWGRDGRPGSAPSTCSGWPGCCRSDHGSSRCSRRSTGASRSGSRVTSTSPSPRPTSSTTPGGPTNSSTPSPAWTPAPLGVVGQVIPWNFPMLMLAWKVAPALATGNTVVLKPAETTPLSALAFARLAVRGRSPSGRPQHRHRRRNRAGAEVVAHPGVDKVAFTGSTEVGKLIQRRLAGTGKRLTLELGGKAPHVIFDDAPLDQASRGGDQRDLLQPGPRLLRGEPPAGPGVGLRHPDGQAEACG